MQFAQKDLKAFLDSEYLKFNAKKYLEMHPDPLAVVHKNLDFPHLSELSFICAIYAYGNASLIVKNLEKMPFSLLLDSKKLQKADIEEFPYYRFQSREDTKNCFLAISHLIENGGLKTIFLESFYRNSNVLDGIHGVINKLNSFIQHKTNGLSFLFGNTESKSPHKRFNMFLRWMVRRDNLDIGLWSEISTKYLLLPLDTHTFRISRALGLCKTKSYSMKAAKEITQNLAIFDEDDPVKYDFALYRIGQLKLLDF